MKRRKLLKKIRRLHRATRLPHRVPEIYEIRCLECDSPHPCLTYRLADGFTRW